MDRLLRDAGGKIELLSYDETGALADVNGTEVPQVTVTDSAGVAVPGFTPSRPSAGTYQATLPGDLDTLDLYDVLWTWSNGQSRRSRFELVGGFFFSIADVRDFDPVLTDAAKYPASKIRAVRGVIEERFEAYCRVAFVPRGRRAVISGGGTSTLLLPDMEVHRLVQVKVDGTALTQAELAEVKVHPFGMLEWDGGTFAEGIRNVEVLYEHGFRSVPAPIQRAALRYAKALLVSATYDDRATAVFTDVGGFRLTLAGRDGPTGLPEVDATLAEFRRAPVEATG
ncbi:MAG TPA: hypothetical protein VNO79_08750 [Actinomycetota bacterium]|nr:hypothetical protein [Actinomycetota bacterium]